MIQPIEIDQFAEPIPETEGRNSLCVWDKTAPPGATDDESDGYEQNSIWYDEVSGKTYRLIDPTEGAAAWLESLTPNSDLKYGNLIEVPGGGILVGRETAGLGAPETITVGSGLTLSGGVLSSSGGGVSIGDVVGGSIVNDAVLYINQADELDNSSAFTFDEIDNELQVNGIVIARPTTNSTVVGTVPASLTGTFNNLFGSSAGNALTSGVRNLFFGSNAGSSVTTTSNNVFIGSDAGINSPGNTDTFIGYLAGGDSTATTSTALGAYAGRYSTGSNNFFAGYFTAYYATGSNNTYIGGGAGYGVSGTSTGSGNFGAGSDVLRNNTTGQYNWGGGYWALRYNTTGQYNFGGGREAGARNLSGFYNIYIGYRAGFGTSGTGTGSYNINIGAFTGDALTSGAENQFLGREAGSAVTIGDGNVYIGRRAGYIATTGSNNVCIGEDAGDNITTGSSNIIIGPTIDAASATADFQLNIGNHVTGSWNSASRTLGFFNVTPIGSPALTDTTGGTPAATLSNVEKAGVADSATINDNFATLWDILNSYGLINA